MLTHAPPKPHRFSNQRPGDMDSANAQAMRDAMWQIFGIYSTPGHDVSDLDLVVRALKSVTGFQPATVRNAILAHARLQDLPMLRALQAETRLLDLPHLAAINREMEELGPEVEREVLMLFDEALVRLFTPKRNNQEFPAPGTATKLIRQLIKKYDPARAYNPNKRKKRENEVDSFAINNFVSDGEERSMLQMIFDGATGTEVHESVLATAREHKTSMLDAAVKLLTGQIDGSRSVVLNVYSPKDRLPGDSVFIPGYGWSSPEDTATVEEWLATGVVKEVDLDEVAEQELGGYAPNAAMRSFAFARDGTCIYPGCSRRADRCQLDHRIPYDEGGATTPANLFSLCAHHHNIKTDRRAFYVPDPVTGDIVWLFEDGTYTIVEPEGLLRDQITPTVPRWRSSLQSVRGLRAKAAEFNAKCHTIVDRFDEDQDLERAKAEIEELEEEYGMTFRIKAQLRKRWVEPPWEEGLVEPVDPPFPDPESEAPGPNPFHEDQAIDFDDPESDGEVGEIA